MVALNFSAEFAEMVARKEKRQTIRRTLRAKVGDKIQLYTGQRTTACRKLVADDPVCISTCEVRISPHGLWYDGSRQADESADGYAELDGFADFAAMLTWFQNRYGEEEFSGYEIRWAWK